MGLGAGLFFPYPQHLFVDHLHATTVYYGELTSAVTASLALVSLVSAPLADRFGQMRLAIVAQVALAAIHALMGAVPVLWVRLGGVHRADGADQHWLGPGTGLADGHHSAGAACAGEQRLQRELAGGVGGGRGAGWRLITIGGYGLPFYLAAGLYAFSALLMIRWLLPKRGQRAADPTSPTGPLERADGSCRGGRGDGWVIGTGPPSPTNRWEMGPCSSRFFSVAT